MNKKGFSLIEMLVVMIIVSLLLVLVMPAIVNVYTSVKRNNLSSKITHIETESLKYANEYKDDIKNQTCVNYSMEDLVQKGIIASDNKGKDEIINPDTGNPFTGYVRICYCKLRLDVSANYVEEYNPNTYYHKGDKIIYNNIIYTCIKDAEPNKLLSGGIVNTNYYQVIECN